MQHNHARLRAGRAAALVAAAVTAAGVAVAASSWASTVALVSGNVVDPSGAPASGAHVVLMAWPDGATLDALPDGADVGNKVLASTTADSSGNYALNPDLSTLGARYTEVNGAVSLELQVFDSAGDSQTTDFSAAAPTSPDAVDGVVASSTIPETASFDMSSATVSQAQGTDAPATYTVTPAVASAIVAAAPAPADSGNLPPATLDGNPFCSGYTKDFKYPGAGGAAGGGYNQRFYNLYSYGPAKVEEQTGTMHAVGVAFNLNDSGWGVNGEADLEVSSGAGGTLTYHGNHTLYNSMNESHFTQTCFIPHTSYTYKDREVRGTSLHDLLIKAPSIYARGWDEANNCSPVRTQGDWVKWRGKDQRFKVGLQTPVVDVWTQTGYTHHFQIDWQPTSSGERLCGSNNNGFATAPFGGGESPSDGCPHGTTSTSYTNGDGATLTDGATIPAYC